MGACSPKDSMAEEELDEHVGCCPGRLLGVPSADDEGLLMHVSQEHSMGRRPKPLTFVNYAYPCFD